MGKITEEHRETLTRIHRIVNKRHKNNKMKTAVHKITSSLISTEALPTTVGLQRKQPNIHQY